MKEITQTGRIPIDSIGLILKNYFRWFKVFAVFQLLPTIIAVAALFLFQKEKLGLLFDGFMGLMMASMSKNPVLMKASLASSMETFAPLMRDPALYAFIFLFIILGIIIGPCLLVGVKHSFYKEINIKTIFTEGISKIWSMLWTLITMIFMVVLVIIANILLFVCATFIAKYIGGWVAIPGIILNLILISSIILYFPIHFFSGNNPFSSLWYSFTTFWKNFGFWLCLGIITGVMSVAIYFIIGTVAFFILRHYMPLPTPALIAIVTNAVMPTINALVPYITFSYILFFPIFVAYPQLLDEEDNINLAPQEEYPSLPDDFFTNGFQNKGADNSAAISQTGANQGMPSVDSANYGAGEGLSKPRAVPNNRPFLSSEYNQDGVNNNNSAK